MKHLNYEVLLAPHFDNEPTLFSVPITRRLMGEFMSFGINLERDTPGYNEELGINLVSITDGPIPAHNNNYLVGKNGNHS
jgi:hypothetical protein